MSLDNKGKRNTVKPKQGKLRQMNYTCTLNQEIADLIIQMS